VPSRPTRKVRPAAPSRLRSVALAEAPAGATFPFTVPAVRGLGTLQFPSAVTFFVGENGSGKSTVLEGIAAAARLPAVGSADLARDATLHAARTLGKAFHLTWEGGRSRRGFFLRAEDFFGFTKRIAAQRAELQQELADLPAQYAGRSEKALSLAAMPFRASLAAMETRYGADLDANSHGQSFIKLFQSRFVPGGLHLLDEPEAPLSPHSQLGLVAMLHDMVTQGAQFVIATHSPILMSFPGATIYTFDAQPVRSVPYDETEHVTVTRAFLNDPERYLRHLLDATRGAQA
jgi:predicted ATPase